MENKTTTELLEILCKNGKASEKYDAGVHDSAFEELIQRSPFFEIFAEGYEESLPWLVAEVENLKEDIKLLKRHKHEEKTGDVMVRI